MSKRALVTGASRGIGKAIATALINEGVTIIGTSRNPDQLQEEDRIPGVSYIALDLRDEASITNVLSTIGNIDILINNAGSSQAGAIEEVPLQKVNQYLQLYFIGVVQLTRGVIPKMRKQNAGWIINITSMAGRTPVPFSSYYAAGKAALNAFTQCLRYELRGTGIQSTIIAPGPIATSIPQDTFQLPNSPYEEKISRMRTKRDISIQEGVKPHIVAQKVSQILQTRHLKPYYPVGKGAKFKTFLIKHLPETLVEKIVLKKYDQL
ncbi:MAG: SDR family oxidoreductase [Promethearchaeota archaeon]